MSGKSVKLIIGVILVVVALVLYVFTSVSYWLAILLAAVGLIFVILSFTGKEKNLPVVAPQSKTPMEVEKEAPVEEATAADESKESEEGEIGPRI